MSSLTVKSSDYSKFQNIGTLRVIPNSNHRLTIRFCRQYFTSLLNFDYFSICCYRESGFTTQRKAAAWIGGSIIASLDTFRQIKVNLSYFLLFM